MSKGLVKDSTGTFREFCKSNSALYATAPLADGLINLCSPQVSAEQLVTLADSMQSAVSVAQTLSDLSASGWVMAVAFGSALVLTVLYIGLIRCGGRCLVWLFLILVLGMFSLLGLVCYFYATPTAAFDAAALCGGDAASSTQPYANMLGQNFTCTCDAAGTSCASTEMTWGMVAAVTAWSLGGIVLCVLVFMHRSLKIATAVATEAGHVLGDLKQMWLIPLYKGLLVVAFLVFWTFLLVFIVAGTPTTVTSDTSGATASGATYSVPVHTLSVEWGWIVYHVFALLWTVQLIKASLDFIIGVAVSAWYFADFEEGASLKRLPAYKWPVGHGIRMVFRYHLGSLALGSFLVALVQLIRLAVEYVDRKTKAAQDSNKLAKAAMCMCKCCLWCLECCMKFITRQAYLMMAIVGENFCFSAKKMFYFSLRNVAKVGVTHGVAGIILFFGKVLVIGLTVVFSFLIITKEPTLASQGVDPLIPCLLCGIIAQVTCGIILKLYSTTIEALLLCFLVDDEKNNGNTSHAPASLRECLDKHAETDKHVMLQGQEEATATGGNLAYEDGAQA